MDPRLQDQLEQNDLYRFLSGLNRFWDKYANHVLVVIIVVLLGIAGMQFYSWWQRDRQESAWFDLSVTTVPEGLEEVAQTHTVAGVRTLATLHAADAYLARAIDTQMNPDDDAQPSADDADASDDLVDNSVLAKADPEEDLANAKRLYQSLSDDASLETTFRLNALLGLAAVAEQSQQWDQAKASYQTLLELAGPGYEAFAAQAQARLDQLPRLADPIPFAAAREQAPTVADPLEDLIGPGTPMEIDPDLNPDLSMPEPQAP